MPTQLSLIVCTYQRPQAVRRLLHALEYQSQRPDEILVVDGSSDTKTETAISEFAQTGLADRLQYYRVPAEARGLTRQRNFGVLRAQGEVIAFLDDDTVPETSYFQEIRSCFERHPEAGGVGGYVTGTPWRTVIGSAAGRLGVYRRGEWERAEDYRWRLRKLAGLTSSLDGGWMPPSGHGRSASYIPPDDRDHQVEFMIGAAFAWRRTVFEQAGFSTYFDGYGLYEDLDFCIRVGRRWPLYLCTAAKVAHYHEPAARPRPYRYGKMVVRNGWYVWRERWPRPAALDRFRWWSTTILLTICRLVDLRGPDRTAGLVEAAGRIAAMLELHWSRPEAAGPDEALQEN